MIRVASGDYLQGLRLWVFLATLMSIGALCQLDRILPFILAEAIKSELGLTDTQIGLITGAAFAICNSIMSLPLARLSDRGNPRLVLLACLVAWSCMTAMGGFAANALVLAASRLGVAIGEAGALPAGHALIARLVAPQHRGIAIGVFAMGVPLGAMIGFAAGGRLSDLLGWRDTLMIAGAFGLAFALAAMFGIRSGGQAKSLAHSHGSFWQSALELIYKPAFKWLLAGAILVGLASAPFYAFAAAFLMRTHHISAAEAGLAFGLPQGLMGIAGMVLGGRCFDWLVEHRPDQMLWPSVLTFFLSAVTLPFALFANDRSVCVLLLIPTMFAFTFMLPLAFGASHLVAGHGRQALASSLVIIGSSLIGPTIGPLMVGALSDWVNAVHGQNGLRYGLLIVPVGCVTTGMALLIANRAINKEVQIEFSSPAISPRSGSRCP